MAKWLKFGALHFSSPGSQVQILGVDLFHSSAMLGGILHRKNRGDVNSGLIFLKQKKEEDCQQMLT